MAWPFKSLRNLVVACLLCLGFWQLGQGAYIPAKAWLAQELMQRAWTRSADDNDHEHRQQQHAAPEENGKLVERREDEQGDRGLGTGAVRDESRAREPHREPTRR